MRFVQFRSMLLNLDNVVRIVHAPMDNSSDSFCNLSGDSYIYLADGTDIAISEGEYCSLEAYILGDV